MPVWLLGLRVEVDRNGCAADLLLRNASQMAAFQIALEEAQALRR